MKRKHKLYSKPKRPFEKTRIEEEALIKEEFGLKNKKELWKANAKVKLIKEKAKNLIKEDRIKQQAFFDKLKKIGFNVSSIAEVLSLDKKDYLQRRLQSVVARKRIAKSIKEARQLITHKKILVGERIVDIPSYIVAINDENKIEIKRK